MRLLMVLLLSGLLAIGAIVSMQARSAVALQGSPTPITSAASGVCAGEQELRGFTVEEQEEAGQPQSAAAIFRPESELVGLVTADDVEHSNESTRFESYLRLSFLTLPPNSCRLQSVFYPSAIITVTAGTLEIFVEPPPDGPANAPAPTGIFWSNDTGSEELTLPGPIAIHVDEWVTLTHRSSVGFWNSGSTDATVVVAAIHPKDDNVDDIVGGVLATSATPAGATGCNGGCRSRP